MKIAHLISAYLPAVGGAQICIHNIAQHHARQGHAVTVITPSEFAREQTGSYSKVGLARGTVFFLKHCYPFGRSYLLNQIKKLQSEHQFDLWQVTIGYPFGVAVIDYFKANHIPCVLRCSGEDIQIKEEVGYGVRRNKSADALIRENYKKFDHSVAISEAMSREYRAIGITDGNITRIPNGVTVERFENVRQRSKKKLADINEGQKIILTVGRNHPKKGFNLIPEIVESLLKVRQDFVWVLVGDGNEDIKRLAEIRGSKVAERIRILPTQGLTDQSFDYPSDELIGIYNAADLFAFPTLIETFGIVVIEAMAAGLPVVTTDAPGVDELVEHEVSGLKSPAGNSQKMAENIQRVLNQPDLYRRLKENVLKQSQSYDWKRISRLYVNVYEECVTRRD